MIFKLSLTTPSLKYSSKSSIELGKLTPASNKLDNSSQNIYKSLLDNLLLVKYLL